MDFAGGSGCSREVDPSIEKARDGSKPLSNRQFQTHPPPGYEARPVSSKPRSSRAFSGRDHEFSSLFFQERSTLEPQASIGPKIIDFEYKMAKLIPRLSSALGVAAVN